MFSKSAAAPPPFGNRAKRELLRIVLTCLNAGTNLFFDLHANEKFNVRPKIIFFHRHTINQVVPYQSVGLNFTWKFERLISQIHAILAIGKSAAPLAVPTPLLQPPSVSATAAPAARLNSFAGRVC